MTNSLELIKARLRAVEHDKSLLEAEALLIMGEYGLIMFEQATDEIIAEDDAAFRKDLNAIVRHHPRHKHKHHGHDYEYGDGCECTGHEGRWTASAGGVTVTGKTEDEARAKLRGLKQFMHE